MTIQEIDKVYDQTIYNIKEAVAHAVKACETLEKAVERRREIEQLVEKRKAELEDLNYEIQTRTQELENFVG